MKRTAIALVIMSVGLSLSVFGRGEVEEPQLSLEDMERPLNGLTATNLLSELAAQLSLLFANYPELDGFMTREGQSLGGSSGDPHAEETRLIRRPLTIPSAGEREGRRPRWPPRPGPT